MADKRLKPIERDVERQKIEDFFALFAEGQVSIHEATRQMRAISRLTQPEFARHRRIALGTLQQLERGDADPKVSTLNKIGDIFGLEVGFVKKRKKSEASQLPQGAVPERLDCPFNTSKHAPSLSATEGGFILFSSVEVSRLASN